MSDSSHQPSLDRVANNFKYHIVIGLEIHVQLNTKTKLMCSCVNEYNPENPNKNICPFCTGQPGALPVMNKSAVKKAMLFGQVLGSKIPQKTIWDRKNYFYPDLPAGYQISQYENPIVEGGVIEFFIENKNTGQFVPSSVELTRAHLETDAAKLIHGGGKTMVDFNRCGAPLIEIVTEPCITSTEQATAFVTELQTLVRHIGISEGNMDQGQMRFDCNLSLQTEEQFKAGKLPNYRTETKNINSIRSLGRAIEYEITRQSALLDKGVRPTQETRGWKDDQNKSVSQRSKEEAMDYRYFPDPDLRILEILESDLTPVNQLPLAPNTIRKELVGRGISVQNANVFLENAKLRDYLESFSNSYDVKFVSNILTGSILSKIAEKNTTINGYISKPNMEQVLQLINNDAINNQNLPRLYDILSDNYNIVLETVDVSKIATDNNLLMLSDTGELLTIVNDVITNNTKVVDEYKSGKVQVIGFLVGQCMKLSKGSGNPKEFTTLLTAELTK